jgi:hypothetical protein
MAERERVVRAWRRLVKGGGEPTFLIDLDPPRVVDLPWVEFFGRRPAEAAEAARRSLAAEIGVRPDQIRVEIRGRTDIALSEREPTRSDRSAARRDARPGRPSPGRR